MSLPPVALVLPALRTAAMILHTWQTTQGPAELYWKHRWAIYVIKAERRLPAKWVQRMRLGQPTWDPVSMKPVYRWALDGARWDSGTVGLSQLTEEPVSRWAGAQWDSGTVVPVFVDEANAQAGTGTGGGGCSTVCCDCCWVSAVNLCFLQYKMCVVLAGSIGLQHTGEHCWDGVLQYIVL